MTTEIVGYHLLEIATGEYVQSWGGTWGQCPGIPDPVFLPNGYTVYNPQLNQEMYGYKLIPWVMEQPALTAADVIVERSRRLAVGFDYDFGSPGTPDVQHIGTTDSDMAGWNEVTTWANSQVALGDTTSTVTILTDTGTATVTALQWMAVLNAASAFRQPIWQASFVLQNMNPIPADYTDDKWWPS